MTLTYLKDLDNEELLLLKKIPALVTILVGAVDDDLNDKEIHMSKVSIEFRKNNGEPLVNEYFDWISKDYDAVFEENWNQYKDLAAEDRTQQITGEITKVNDILAKIDKRYAHALVVSWRGLSRAVANASGGILGRAAISYEEQEMMGLNMIDLQ